ncbi:hypothetical protein [Hyphococcus sp.]|uniref:hypothetical protein n=1 Tax=Hyphococcus sp. TaxID=2038636 RepID=UPI003CCC135C
MTQTSGLQQAASSARPLFTPDFFSFEGVLQTLTSGQFAGPLQIALAVLLFVAAGRCIARFLGLAIAAAVIFLYLQGVTVEDSMMFFERFADRISAAVQAFLSADVAPQ